MIFKAIKYVIVVLIMILFLVSCDTVHDNRSETANISQTIQSERSTENDTIVAVSQSEETQPAIETVVDTSETDDSVPIETSSRNTDDISQRDERYVMAFYTYGDLLKDQSQLMSITLPSGDFDIDTLKTCAVLSITLTEKVDLSFLAELPQLKALSISNGEENAVPDPSDESYVESYDFLNSLNNLEYLRIGKEPSFNTEYLDNLDSLKYLQFYGTNVDLAGYFPNLDEFSISGGRLSSEDLYEFFPNLTGLGITYNSVNLESVGKMEKLEMLTLSIGQSNDGIEAIANNKNLRSFILATMSPAPTPVENDKFILELTNLRYFWCFEGVFSEETISRFKELNPECEVCDIGQW